MDQEAAREELSAPVNLRMVPSETPTGKGVLPDPITRLGGVTLGRSK